MDKDFGSRLKTVRESRGLSQSDLAAKTGLQPSAISHFETNSRSPSFDNLKRLADALNVSTDHLLGRTTEAAIAGPAVDRLFRHGQNLTDEDWQAMESMAEALAKKNSGRGKGK
jgi:transcriptional regulator with XRE-family HTH domain